MLQKKKKNRLSYALERVVRCHLATFYTYHTTLNIIMVGSRVTMYCELRFTIFKVKPWKSGGSCAKVSLV